MYDQERTIPANDFDSILLEGLFQLTVAGETTGGDFQKIDDEVYTRLMAAYQA